MGYLAAKDLSELVWLPAPPSLPPSESHTFPNSAAVQQPPPTPNPGPKTDVPQIQGLSTAQVALPPGEEEGSSTGSWCGSGGGRVGPTARAPGLLPFLNSEIRANFPLPLPGPSRPLYFWFQQGHLYLNGGALPRVSH